MMVDMKGFVEYEDKQYPFSFSDSTLNLYPDKFDSKSIECKLRSNGMPVPLLRNGYSIFNGTKYR